MTEGLYFGENGMDEQDVRITYEILYSGSNAMLRVKLEQGERIKAESGAMVATSDTIDVKGKMEGGLIRGIARKLLAGEKFFFQTLNAIRGAGEVLLAPASMGDIGMIELKDEGNYVVQKDGFFAAIGDLVVGTTMQNLARGLFSGEGFFILKISGRGILFINSFGAIHPIDIPPEEEFIIDNKHLVAWPESGNYRIEPASKGWISSITSGEILVCRFRGPCRVFIQSRNPDGFCSWLKQYIPMNRCRK